MTKYKSLAFIAIAYCVPLSLIAGESWAQAIKNIIFSNDVYTRHQLYKKLKDGSADYETAVNIQENQEHYLDMIEESVLKREQNGSKEGKVIGISKVGLGIAQLSALIIGCCALDYYKIKYPDIYTVPAALFMAGLGLRNLYKGIFYKSRMEQKLERDKFVRRTIREIVGQI